jgi:Na+/melibiose symporter-like transporter
MANVEQAGRSLHGIILSMSWIPCAMLVSATVAMALYQLDDSFMIKIEEELEMRRAEIGG